MKEKRVVQGLSSGTGEKKASAEETKKEQLAKEEETQERGPRGTCLEQGPTRYPLLQRGPVS